MYAYLPGIIKERGGDQMLSPDIPPWRCPVVISVHSGRGADMGTHLAKPEKSGGAKLRDWDGDLAECQDRYVRRTAPGKTGEIL